MGFGKFLGMFKSENKESVMAGPNNRLESKRRLAQRYLDEDEEKKLDKFLAKRRFEEGRSTFSDKGILNEGQKLGRMRSGTSALDKDRMFFGKMRL